LYFVAYVAATIGTVTIELAVCWDALKLSVNNKILYLFYKQGEHSPGKSGKHGKIRELDSGQGKL